MGKRKNQQRRKKKAGNLYSGPIPKQKTENTVTSTDKKMHSSLTGNVDIVAQKSNLTQPLNYALALKKESRNIKNPKIPENKETEVLIENKFCESKIRTFQDTVEEDMLDFLGFPCISDCNTKSEKTITQTSKPVKQKAAVNQITTIKYKNKSCTTNATSLDQDFEEKTVAMSFKQGNDLNVGKYISHESTSYDTSEFQYGSKFVNEKYNFKKKNAASNQIKGMKHTNRLCATYSTSTVQDKDFKEKTGDISVKESGDLKNVKCLSNENTSYATSKFHSGYKFANEKDNFKAQHSREISNTASKIKNGKNGHLHIKGYETSTCKIQEKLVNNMQKEVNLSVKKYNSDKSSSSAISLYQPHYDYVNERKSLKPRNSNKITMPKNNYSNRKDLSSYPESATYSEILDTESQRMKNKIYSTINAFKESNYYLDKKYKHWLKTRIQTLENLKKLVKDLHDYQLAYNKAQKTCREIGCASRIVKPTPSTLGYIASVSAFLSDAASGITSFLQAVNIDGYSKEFEEIMNLDSKATKDLYDARSQCLVEYRGIEEVMRKYHSPTFNSTVSKISNDLKLKQFWMDVSNAYENDDTSKMLSIVGNFLESRTQLEVLQKIGNSIVSYVDENPAAKEVCNSVCRAASGAIDSLFLDTRRNTALSLWAQTSNRLKIMDDKMEINRLRYITDGDSSQCKLEDKIYDAIDSLTFEMKQITDACIQLVSDRSYD